MKLTASGEVDYSKKNVGFKSIRRSKPLLTTEEMSILYPKIAPVPKEKISASRKAKYDLLMFIANHAAQVDDTTAPHWTIGCGAT